MAMKRARLLTAEEEQALAERIVAGDADAVNQLVEANLAMVVALATRYPLPGVDFEELVAAGNLGLVEAARAYCPGTGSRFMTFATRYVVKMVAAELNEGIITVPLHARKH